MIKHFLTILIATCLCKNVISLNLEDLFLQRSGLSTFMPGYQPKIYPFIGEIFAKVGEHNFTFACLTSLVAFSWTITAASCKDPSIDEHWVVTSIYIKYGWFLGQQHKRVAEWITHVNYTESEKYSFNIALVKIAGEFKIKPYVNFIRLFPYSELKHCDLALKFKTCKLISFDKYDKLRKYKVNVDTLRSCMNVPVEETSSLIASHTCSRTMQFTPDHYPKNFGDLGAPLICGKQQIAIAIANYGCKYLHRVLYTRVDIYQEWIKSYVTKGLWYIESLNPAPCENVGFPEGKNAAAQLFNVKVIRWLNLIFFCMLFLMVHELFRSFCGLFIINQSFTY